MSYKAPTYTAQKITVGIGGRFYRQWNDCVWLTISDVDHPELPNWSSEALTPC